MPPPLDGAGSALALDAPNAETENGLGGGKLGAGDAVKEGSGGGANEGAGAGANADALPENAESVLGRSNVLPPAGPRMAPRSLPACSDLADGACVNRSIAALRSRARPPMCPWWPAS